MTLTTVQPTGLQHMLCSNPNSQFVEFVENNTTNVKSVLTTYIENKTLSVNQ